MQIFCDKVKVVGNNKIANERLTLRSFFVFVCALFSSNAFIVFSTSSNVRLFMC